MAPVLNFWLASCLLAAAFAAPQGSSNRPDGDEPGTAKSSPSSPPVHSDDGRKEHRKIVPFQFNRSCRDLDLKRQNCSCLWEATYQNGLEAAITQVTSCLAQTEEEIASCLRTIPGYEDCINNEAFDTLRVTDDEHRCHEFGLNADMCSCMKNKDAKPALKQAIDACRSHEPAGNEQDGGDSDKKDANSTAQKAAAEKPKEQPEGSKASEKPKEQPEGSKASEKPKEQPEGGKASEKPAKENVATEAPTEKPDISFEDVLKRTQSSSESRRRRRQAEEAAPASPSPTTTRRRVPLSHLKQALGADRVPQPQPPRPEEVPTPTRTRVKASAPADAHKSDSPKEGSSDLTSHAQAVPESKPAEIVSSPTPTILVNHPEAEARLERQVPTSTTAATVAPVTTVTTAPKRRGLQTTTQKEVEDELTTTTPDILISKEARVKLTKRQAEQEKPQPKLGADGHDQENPSLAKNKTPTDSSETHSSTRKYRINGECLRAALEKHCSVD